MICKHVRRRVMWGLCLLLVCALAGCRPQWSGTTPEIKVAFSPRGGCTDAIVQQLDAAQQSVLVQAYSFTSAPIARALVQAHKRGVHVEVILDKSQRSEKYSSADFVAHAGIPTYIDAEHAIAHNKIMIIDARVVITGSFNFTKSAEEHNAENLLVIHDPGLAAAYTANWKAHAAHSETYEGRGSEPGSLPAPSAGRSSGPSEEQVRLDADPSDEYVTSINSEVFHRRTCRLAAKIAEKNRITFATRGDALSAGKRPCTECKP
jgi:phosphatidylserine/phosphatidylglycerophosphate/cardiolipin synthase-like enzyme